MNIIKIGEPITTGTGTKISKYIENGRLYKLIDFRHSTNRVAKEKGLVRTTVRYGNGNLPETCFDTFERKITHGTRKPIEKPETASQISAKPTEVPSSKTKIPKLEEQTENITPIESTGKESIDKSANSENIFPKNSSKSTNVVSGHAEKDIEGLVSITKDSFSRETAKKLYSGISKYIKVAGKNGSFKEVRLMTEQGVDKPCAPALAKGADIVFSLDRAGENMHLTLTRKNIDKSQNDILFDALVNKEGQMVEGRYPLEHMTFVRRGANVRRIRKSKSQFLPIAGNDREWACNGSRISSTSGNNLWYAGEEDNAISGAFEIFMEMARLHTSVLK